MKTHVEEPHHAIRAEMPQDVAAIHAVHVQAFPMPAEAHLVARLRAVGRLALSLVAVIDEVVVGHVALSPVTIDGADVDGLGLGPVAVLPAHQNGGIGACLVERALAAAADSGAALVVVLGDPAYYGRFGFRRARDLGLDNEYGADEAFMVNVLRQDTLPTGGGLVRYAPEFAEVGA